MDRFAVFVDAGYVLACGAALACRRRVASRAAVTVQYRAFVDRLIQQAQAECGLELLRVYWYDGATNATPTTEHLSIGDLPHVKIRMGRLVKRGGRLASWEQKGVDTLIVLDLTTLARERAINTAFLISGDEDLREGVAAAQQLGVRVVLWGMEPLEADNPNQAATLIREADIHTVMNSEGLVLPFFAEVVRAAPAPAEAPAASGDHTAEAPEPSIPESVGKKFVTDWLASKPPPASVEELKEANKKFPRRIPATLDAELLATGRSLIANPLSEVQKRGIRKGFWEGLVDSDAAVAR